MKIGFFTILFQGEPLEKVLDKVIKLGINTVEIGSGGFVGKGHCDPSILLKEENKLEEFRALFQKKNITVSALSCHANPLHPNKEIVISHTKDLRETVLLAEKMGIERVVTFAGCPGSSDQDRYPNWITCPWPDYFSQTLKWQWEEKIIPFWKEQAKFVQDHGVKICFEMHPGDAVHTPEKLLRLRDEGGEVLGCNLDPSHLFWQGIDPLQAIRELGDAIYYVHAKDTRVDPYNTSRKGVLDTTPYQEESKRSWLFRTVGYGHDYAFWKDFISQLRLVGYDDVLSIEHEDSLLSPEEGLRKAVIFLKEVIVEEKPGKMWWD